MKLYISSFDLFNRSSVGISRREEGTQHAAKLHVGELAIISALLNAVKRSRVRATQGRIYLIKRRLFCFLLLHTYYRIAIGSRIAAEQGVVKAQGSWVTLDTPAQNIIEYFLPRPKLMLLLVCLLGLQAFKNISLFYEHTDLSHCMSLKVIVFLREKTILFQCVTTCLYIYFT